MGRRTKFFARTLLIVCEGENSEPGYFGGLAARSKAEGVYSHIEIFPSPKTDDEADLKKANPNRKQKEKGKHKRKQKEFKPGRIPVNERPVDPADSVEAKYVNPKNQSWPTPVRYIKEARDRIKSGAYNEVWAVFDKDGHPKIAEAFELAAIPINNKTVNIAFSSISFEHWLLLHFERNNNPFTKSECKDSTNNKPKGCGTGIHPEDCNGKSCVVGLLRTNEYLPNYSKRGINNIFNLTENGLSDALINAAWLRYIQQTTADSPNLYNLNPITTIDLLVKTMLGLNKEFHFLEYGSNIRLLETIELRAQRDDSTLNVNIRKLRDETFLGSEFKVSFNKTGGKPLQISEPTTIGPEFSQTVIDIPPNSESISLEFRDNMVFFTN